MTNINNDDSYGRFCNQLIRSIATSFIAKKHNLRVTYGILTKLQELGIDLFNGDNIWNNTIELTDFNYFDILEYKSLESNINPNKSFFQTRKIINLIYEKK